MLPADSALLNRKIIVCITQKLVNNWQNNSYSPYHCRPLGIKHNSDRWTDLWIHLHKLLTALSSILKYPNLNIGKVQLNLYVWSVKCFFTNKKPWKYRFAQPNKHKYMYKKPINTYVKQSSEHFLPDTWYQCCAEYRISNCPVSVSPNAQRIPDWHNPAAQTVEHGACNNKVMGFIPRECMNLKKASLMEVLGIRRQHCPGPSDEGKSMKQHTHWAPRKGQNIETTVYSWV